MVYFKYLGMTIINQNYICKEIRSSLSLQNTSYVTKNVNIKIHRSIILPLFCMGVKLGNSPPKEEHTLRVFEENIWT
jgi:hypothetical protein